MTGRWGLLIHAVRISKVAWVESRNGRGAKRQGRPVLIHHVTDVRQKGVDTRRVLGELSRHN